MVGSGGRPGGRQPGLQRQARNAAAIKAAADGRAAEIENEIEALITFKAILKALETESELLRLNNQQRAIRVAQLDAEEQLERDLTETELARLAALVSLNEELQVKRNVLDAINAPLDTYKANLEAVNSLLAKNKITSGQAAEATRDLRIAYLEISNSLEDGFERAFLKIGKDVDDFARLSENLVTNSFRGMEDALVDFVRTGKLEFSSLADSIIADLARMAIRQSITKPLFNIFTNFLSPGATEPIGRPPGVTGFFKGGGLVQGATGGLLQGGGSGTSDSIPVRLSDGEFVINAANTKQFLPLLTAINNFSGGGGQSKGGGVVVQVIDQRSGDAPPVERQERVSGDGSRTIALIIKDAVSREISGGGLDKPFQSRFGLTPALRG